MAKQTHPGIRLLDELLLSNEFRAKIRKIHKLENIKQPIAIQPLMEEYRIPSNFYSLLLELVRSGKRKHHLVSSPASVISEIEKTSNPSDDPSKEYRIYKIAGGRDVYISLSHDIKKKQLIDFIEKNWKPHIKPALEKIAPHKRISYKQMPERDKKLRADYKNRKKLGYKTTDLAEKYGVSVTRVYQIVNERKM